VTAESGSLAKGLFAVVAGSLVLGQSTPSRHAESVADSVTLTIIGAPDTVFRAPDQACEQNDRPDGYAHATRTSAGIMLLSGNAFGNYVMTGPDLHHLTRDCGHPRLLSANKPDPSSFLGREWIVATYRVGSIIHALVHNEFHDAVSPLCMPGESGPANPCWYNAVTYAFSNDDGVTFHQGADVVIAAPTSRWNPQRGAPAGKRSRLYGYFGPSSIVRRSDGYYYSTFVVINNPDSARGTCVMRTRELSNPKSWRAWDGKTFSHQFDNPYSATTTEPGQACAAVSPDLIHDFGGSLTYNTYLNRYVLTGFSTRQPGPGPKPCGFAFSFSVDLVTWTRPQVFATADPPSKDAPDCMRGDMGMAYYPSLIDPSDSTTNFEMTGRTPFLYYVSGLGSPRRALIRVRVRFDDRSRAVSGGTNE